MLPRNGSPILLWFFRQIPIAFKRSAAYYLNTFKRHEANMMNRETWLNELATLMAPRFEEMGFPIPPYRVTIGFTSAGKSGMVAGECWHSSRSADKRFEILVSPIRDDSVAIAGTLAHELAHAAAGFDCGHKGNFAKIVLALGLLRHVTASQPGPAFVGWVQPFLDKLGPIPHAKLSWDSTRQPVGGGDGDDDEPAGKGSSNQKKTQSTRMLKATCSADMDGEPCGYTVRLSKKWALKYGACCPVHGAMEVEGADDSGGDEDADE